MSADPTSGSTGVPSPLVPPTVPPPTVPPAVANAPPAETPATPRIALRVALLIALTVAVNAWGLLQFGIKLGSFFLIELTVVAAVALTKLLSPKDNETVQRALRRLFYALLSYSLLIAGYVALLAVTLNLSTVVVQGGDAAKTCISSGNSGCAPNVTSDEKGAVFLARTSVRGRDYTARV